MRVIIRFVNYLKTTFNLSSVLSIVAISVSIITMYFQFFNVKHELLYTYLFPSVGDKLNIPIVYKNNGNKNELILESNIEIEIIPDDGSDNYFKRIGDDNKRFFPIVIAPGEYKTITMSGDYKEYFKGMLEQSQTGIKYRKITNLDKLKILLTTKLLSNDGISEVKRMVGKITFNKDRTFNRFDFQPIKLVRLESDDDSEMVGGSLINANRSVHLTSLDSLTSDQIEQLKFFINVVEDTTMKKELIKFLRRKGIDYSK